MDSAMKQINEIITDFNAIFPMSEQKYLRHKLMRLRDKLFEEMTEKSQAGKI